MWVLQKNITHLTFLCCYLPTIWSLVTAFIPEFRSRQQKSKGRGAKLFIIFFTQSYIRILFVNSFCGHLFVMFFCFVSMFCLVKVSNSLLSICECLLLLTCFVHGQEAEANA